jgi:hypothetical protein
MKTLKATLLLVLFALPFISQAQHSEMDMMRKLFSAEKRALAENFLKLNGTDANAFWEQYDAYEAERKGLADKRISLIEKYAEQYASLTNDQATSLVNESFKLKQDRLNLRKKYFKKISKAVDAKTATSFLQLEEYIATAITFDLYDSIPFVGE